MDAKRIIDDALKAGEGKTRRLAIRLEIEATEQHVEDVQTALDGAIDFAQSCLPAGHASSFGRLIESRNDEIIAIALILAGLERAGVGLHSYLTFMHTHKNQNALGAHLSLPLKLVNAPDMTISCTELCVE